MRIVLMGTGPFALPAFQAVVADGHEVPLLVTRPPVEQRGKKPPPSPVRAWGQSLGLPLFDPPDINQPQAVATLADLGADLLLVCDYGQILSAATLAVTPWGGINLHGSLLPKYRGAAPIQWCLYHGDRETGVSVLHMTPRLDGGPLLAVIKTVIDPAETAVELEPRLAELGATAVRQALVELAAWDGRQPIGVPQDPTQVTRAPRLRKSDGQIDWSRSAQALVHQIRAFQPWPGSFTHWSRPSAAPLRLIITAARVAPHNADPLADLNLNQTAPQHRDTALSSTQVVGQLVRVDCDTAWVQTGYGVLELLQVQPSGKRVMAIAEFMRGYPLAVGDHFQ